MACASKHLWWSTLWGGIFGEDGRYDAFATVMEILRVGGDNMGGQGGKGPRFAVLRSRARGRGSCYVALATVDGDLQGSGGSMDELHGYDPWPYGYCRSKKRRTSSLFSPLFLAPPPLLLAPLLQVRPLYPDAAPQDLQLWRAQLEMRESRLIRIAMTPGHMITGNDTFSLPPFLATSRYFPYSSPTLACTVVTGAAASPRRSTARPAAPG